MIQLLASRSLHLSGESYLANTIDTSGESHTSAYLVSLLTDQISVVTDNAANVTGMRAAYIVPGVHSNGCQAHVFNLLANDIAQSANNNGFNGKLTSIIKFLRNNHAASPALKTKKLARPPLYTETR